MLKLEHIAKTFNPGTINEKHAIRDLSLELADGDFVTVIGGNGAGKSTLLNAVAGVWPVDAGSIFIGGEDVTGMPEYKRARFIGRVFQDPMMGTAPNMQIEENLALANRRGKRRGLRWGVTQAERENYRQLLTGLGLGLEKRMTAKVGLLSGGQRQALTLLMAALQTPKLLLLDEHTAALDPATAAKVLELSDKIIHSLKGIGVWTAEMILLFCMQRQDVLSCDDLAIQRGLRMVYHHRKIDRGLFEKYRRRFSPYGSVASLYLWAVSGGAIPELHDYAPKEKK